MTPRKFDLETALVVLQDEFGCRLIRDLGQGGGDKNKGWYFEAYNSNTRHPICPTVEEAAKRALRKTRQQVQRDRDEGAAIMLQYGKKLELIKSLGNIGKDDE